MEGRGGGEAQGSLTKKNFSALRFLAKDPGSIPTRELGIRKSKEVLL
jgi:DNA-binding response OmpR family regulator